MPSALEFRSSCSCLPVSGAPLSPSDVSLVGMVSKYIVACLAGDLFRGEPRVGGRHVRVVRTVFSVFGIQLRRRRCRLARASRQMLAGSACGTTIKTKEPYNCRHPPAPSVLSCPSKLNAKMDCLFIGRACARTSRRRLSLVGFVNASEFGWNPASRARRQITYLGYGDAGRGGHDSIHLTAGRPPIVKQVGGFPSAGRVVVVPLLDKK